MSTSNGQDGVPEQARAANRIAPFFGPTVWQEFTPLAIAHKSVNLGQGFPDWKSPEFVIDAETAAVRGGFNQYARSMGHPRLVEAIAKKYSPRLGRTLNGLSNVVVTVGASQVLFTIFQSFCNPGDEVIVFEPFFDIYVPQIVMTGAKPVYVPLVRNPEQPGPGGAQWVVDWKRLEAAVSPRTRMIVVNTPHNPTGKVFNREELERLAGIVKAHPHMICVADEVYEHIMFDGNQHISIASLPGMFERTITVSSAGKTFSVTGWKIGWAIGTEEVCKALATCQQWVSFSVSTPHQEAIATALELAEQPFEGFATYYEWLADRYRKKRDHLFQTLTQARLNPIPPQGSFFILADTRDIAIPEAYLAENGGSSRDYAFCRYMTKEAGVTAIPPTAFYCPEDKPIGQNYARFAFCKEDTSLDEARKRLTGYFGSK